MLLNELFATEQLHLNILLEEVAGEAPKTGGNREKIAAFAKKVAAYLKKYPDQTDAVSKIFGIKLNESMIYDFGANQYLIEGRDDINSVILDFYDTARLDEGIASGIKKGAKMGVAGAKMGVAGAKMGVKGAKMGIKGAKMGVAGVKKGVDGAKKGAELAVKLKNKVESSWAKLENTAPAKNVNAATARAISDYKNKLGPDHRAVKYATALGQYAEKNPKMSSAIVGILSGLTSFIGTPAGGLAVGVALRTALGLAKGEKLTTAVAKSAVVGGFAAVGGAVIGNVVDGLASANIGLADIIVDTDFTPSGKDVSMMNIDLGSEKYNMLIPNDKIELVQQATERFKSGGGDTSGYLKFLDSLYANQENYMGMSSADEATLEKIKSQHAIVKSIGSAIGHATGGAAGAVKGEGSKKDQTKFDTANGKIEKAMRKLSSNAKQAIGRQVVAQLK